MDYLKSYKDIKFQVRLSDSLLLFYIALTSNFLVNFFPKTHLDFVKNNIFAKYLLGFLTMLFSIYHISTLENPVEVVIIALGLFVWFLMTTHLPPYYSVFIITILAIAFLINLRIYKLDQDNYSQETQDTIDKYKTIVMSLFIFILVSNTIAYIYYRFIKS